MRDSKWVKDKLDILFNPRNLAVVGASRDPEKWGFIVFSRILDRGYKGEVFPINPNASSILGKKAYASVLDVPVHLDLVVIMSPAQKVLGVVKECARKKVETLIIISSNFSEVGEEGARLEREVIELVRKSGMIAVGPNSMGILSEKPNLVCLMAPVIPLYGKVSSVSQSGNVGTHTLIRGRRWGVGFNKFVSSGNEGDLSFDDYLEYFGEDEDTEVIVGYLEGLDPENRFLERARKITLRKPVVIYKGGKSEAGNRAVVSHTGALAGSYEVVKGAFRQVGIVQAETNEEVAKIAKTFQYQPLPRGKRVGILTRGGGWGVVSADACASSGLEVVRLSEGTISKLDKILPPYWSRGNPVDMVATLSGSAYLQCLEILLEDPNVDGVLALGVTLEGQSQDIARILTKAGEEEKAQEIRERWKEDINIMLDGIVKLIKDKGKPVLTVGRWENNMDAPNELLPLIEPEEASHIFRKLLDYSEFRRRHNY